MLDTSVGKFLSHLKILAADFNRIRISFLKLCCIIMILSCCFVFFFFPRPAILTAEGDGWTSLCSFADRRAGSMSVLGLLLVCVGTRAQRNLCTKDFLGFWRSSSASA